MNSASPSLSTPALPIEVWSNIFMNIDNPLDLMRARKVCKQWNQEINRVLEFANWKKLCLREIGASSLSSIVAVVRPTLSKANYRAIDDQDFWRHVYYHYKKWLRIKELPVQIAQPRNNLLLSPNESITCFDIWGDWVMYGTNIGRVYILQDLGHKKRRRAIDHHIEIIEVKIWHDDNGNILFLAVMQSQLIKIGYPEIKFTLSGHKPCVGTAKNLYYAQDNIIIKLKSITQNISVASAIELNLDPREHIVAMNSRESKIFVVVQNERKLRVFEIEDESFTKKVPNLQIQSILTVPSLPVVPLNMQVYVTLNRTIMCRQDGIVCLHTPETDLWMTCNEPMRLNINVTALIMHGNYLIIGLSDGNLWMYYIDATGDVINPDLFRKQSVRKFKLDVGPIIAIKITDVDEQIHMTAFSEKKMFTLIF